MKNGKTEHFQRIHAKVCRRLWTDLPLHTRDVIAGDPESKEAEWFSSKTTQDATRLYEDPAYYDNAEPTFRLPKYDEGKITPLAEQLVEAWRAHKA